jgi:AcrR family transcriptional regulator
MFVMAIRLSRVEQVERNRELVLAAARKVFLNRGYGAATLEAIAEEAGFSKGVMYSQFRSKADLFLTLLDRRISERAAENADIAARLTGPDAVRALLHAGAMRSEESQDWTRLLIEFRVIAVRDPELNRRYAELHERTVVRFTEVIRQALEMAGIEPWLSPRHLAQFALAFDLGAALERAADPEALPMAAAEQLLTRALDAPATDSVFASPSTPGRS